MEDWKIKISVLWLFSAVAFLAHQILALLEPGIIGGIIAGEVEGMKIGIKMGIGNIIRNEFMYESRNGLERIRKNPNAEAWIQRST